MLEKPISAQGNISDKDNLFFLLILYSDHDDSLHELAAPRRHSPTITRRLVVSYTTFSPLPPTRSGGHFLLPTPTVTNSFYFRK